MIAVDLIEPLWQIIVIEAPVQLPMGCSPCALWNWFLGFAHHCCNSQWHSKGFHLTLPFCRCLVPLHKLPGYGNILEPASSYQNVDLVLRPEANLILSPQTRNHPPQHGIGPRVGSRDYPLRLPSDRRRVRGTGRGSESGGARSEHRRDREPQTRRYLRE